MKTQADGGAPNGTGIFLIIIPGEETNGEQRSIQTTDA